VIPTYDNAQTVRSVVECGRRALPDVIVVDDGSGPEGRAACEGIAKDGLAHVERFDRNQGKGRAVGRGFAVARELGFTHCFQVDADSQHDLDRIPAFLTQARDNPAALIAGYPEYDETAPRVRKIARKITAFWVGIEAGRGTIRDALLGFRVYPLAPFSKIDVAAQRMDFDTEVAVRLVWAGVPVINLPVPVRYLQKDAGGVSHFDPLGDNFRLFKLHSRLCTELCTNTLLGRSPTRTGPR
jgi:glycosyltransferase involved in cell wall biosynthesis